MPGVDYYGHVFWDMETWMYPAILMLRPDLARQMLSYRINGMVPAFQRAASGGYQVFNNCDANILTFLKSYLF